MSSEAFELNHCPALRDYNPFDAEHLADPFPLWRLAQREAPVFYVRNADFWAVTSHEDVLKVVKDTETFTSRYSLNFPPVPEPLRERLPQGFPQAFPSLINSDPPEHARIRKLANRTLTPKHVAEMRPSIRAIAEQLIDGFAADGEVDFVERFAIPFPVTVIARFLGVDERDLPTFQRWSNDAFLMANPMLPHEDFLRCAEGMAELNDYLTARIEERRATPQDDLLSRLVHAQEESSALTNEQIISVTAQLLIGGNVTTTDLLGNMMQVLLTDPERLAAVRADRSLIPAAIEEVLRVKSSIRGLFRTTTRPVELGGAHLPEGATVWVVFGATNHDESVFADPESYDCGRSNLNEHLSFGRGAHFCIGAPLARAEAEIALDLVLDRLPNAGLVEDQQLVYPPSPISLGVDSLSLRWDVAQEPQVSAAT